MEDDDGNTGLPHEPNSELHPMPQYSFVFPQYQYCEQHDPNVELAHVVLLPHIPLVVMTSVEDGTVEDTVVLGVGMIITDDEVALEGNGVVLLNEEVEDEIEGEDESNGVLLLIEEGADEVVSGKVVDIIGVEDGGGALPHLPYCD